MSTLSPKTRDLFAAARDDAPSDQARSRIWSEVALETTAIASGVGAGAATSLGATAAKGKLLFLGGAIGASVTAIGVAVVFAFATPTMPSSDSHDRSEVTPTSESPLPLPFPPSALERARDESVSPKPRAIVKSESSAAPRRPARSDRSTTDLAEEARLVRAARGALLRGDAAGALALVQETRRLSARALEPEELVLESRALRALGRTDDAAATELVLRRRYPESALAR